MVSVAVVGMGRMGAAMAGRLAGAGMDVTVWNRTSERAAAVAGSIGADAVATPADAARAADVVVASLADDGAVRTVHLGEDGTVHGADTSTVVIETSTVDPATIREVAAGLAPSGARLLDAPVSGSVSLVEAGQLTVMVGGDGDAVNRSRPVLEVLAKAHFHLGPNGAGSTMKLAVNALVHATNLAISEALVLAESAGIERSAAYEVFAAGAGASPFVHYKRDAFVHPEEAPVAFSVDLMAKDLDLILGLSRRLGVAMAQGEATAEVTRRAVDAGLGPLDMSALAGYLRTTRTG